MPFRPRFWPTVFTLPALALLLGLGLWQLERMQWTAALIEEVRTRGAAPAVALPADQRTRLADVVFRPVKVTGRYDFDSELFLLNQVRAGKPGLRLITPLARTGDGGLILVDRGWVSQERREPESRPGSQPGGDVTIVGIALVPEPPGWRTPANNPAENEWYFMDLMEMSEAVGIWPAAEYYIFATAESPAGDAPSPAGNKVAWPMVNEWKIAISNDHLSYAIVCFFLSAGLVIGWVALHLRRRPDDDV